jgi:hypothetical protein
MRTSNLRPPPPLLALLLGVLSAAAACAGEEPAIKPPSLPDSNLFFRAINTPAGQPWKLARDTASFSRSILATTKPAPPEGAWDLRSIHALTVNAAREKAGPSVVRLRWVLKSRVGGEYASAAPVVVPVASTAPVSVALEPEAAELVPSGHQRPWDALAAAEITAIELRAECTFSPIAKDDSIAVTLIKGALEKAKPSRPPGASVLDVSLAPPPPFYRAKAQITFRIDPLPAEPYASNGEGDVRIQLPDGKEVLAFLDQNFVTVSDGQATRDVPSGLPFWRAILPELPARGSLLIISGERRWPVALDALTLTENPAPRGEANIATEPEPAVPQANAERWSVPLEVAPPDRSEACKGLSAGAILAGGAWQLATDDSLAGAAKLWRPVPFWNGAWGEFGGMVRPNIVLARKMDAQLAQAAAAGKRQPLVILDGEMFDRDGTFNWSSHPLKGQIAGPGELYRSAQGSEFCRRCMRYCIARWGLSKAVSSLCLTPLLNAPGAPEFHVRAAPLLAAWTRELALPLASLHPVALPPSGVKVVATFEADNRNIWRVDRRAYGSYGNPISQDGSQGHGCFEMRAGDPASKEIFAFENYGQYSVQWKRPAADDFFAVDTLFFDAWVPPDAPPDLRVGVHLRDRDGNWYQALLYGMPQPGDWRTFAVDLSGRNLHGLKPSGHTKPWNDYSRQRLTEIGIHVYSTHPNWLGINRDVVVLRARFDNVRAALLHADEKPAPAAISLLNPEAARTRELSIGQLWQCDLQVNKTFANPFDAAECDLAALITTPSGKTVRVPAFFNQACKRREALPGGDEIVEADGSEFFSVRYRALEAGPHKVAFELREGGKYNVTAQSWQPDSRFSAEGVPQEQPGGRRRWGQNNNNGNDNGRRKVESIAFSPGTVTASLKLDEPAFVAKAAGASKHPFHGFLRVAADKRHFQYDDGSFFYPLGPCLRSPSDSRIPYMDRKWNPQDIDKWSKRGTYQYDAYFQAFEDAGINWARVWMCSWWGSLEWRRDWPGYQGVGRYNLLNAWRIDHLLEVAEERGILIDLCLTNHGQFSLFIDAEWHNNPYSSKLGGPLQSASEFFTRAEAKIAHQNKLRYVVARYGHSPAVMAWSLFSEIEWTEEYEPSLHWRQEEPDTAAPNIETWHTEMAGYLKALDPNQHMVATHFSHPIRGEGTLSLPAIDYATSNAYSAFDEFKDVGQQFNAPFALASFWSGIPNSLMKGFAHFKKPALVEEQGRHWAGGFHNPKDSLEADLHCGLWGSLMQPLGGATGYWWWLHLHYDDKYSEYQALARFVDGEDFRPAKGETDLEPTFGRIDPENRGLSGRAMKSDRRMYLWVYSATLPFGGASAEVSDGKFTVRTLKPGKYTVEFWNTRNGTRIEQRDAELVQENGQPVPMVIALPTFKGDVAVKIKPK